MTTSEVTNYDPLTYRRLSTACFLLAGVAAFVGAVADYLYVGIAAYAVLCVAGFGVRRTADATLFDERDRALEQRASHLTLTLAAGALIVGASAARLVPRVSSYAVPPEVWPALYAYVALFCVFGIAYTWLRHR